MISSRAPLPRQTSNTTEILIVEDERVTAWDLQEALESLGYQIVGSTGSGRQAIRLATEKRPDLILMDICLADEMDGITAAAQVRQQLGIPVVYLTAYADDSTLERALQAQPFGYLVKPFNRIELRTTIETALYRYQLERQLDTLQQWFSTTLNSIGDGAIATDRLGLIQFVNPAAEELLGRSILEVLGQPAADCLSLIHSDSRIPIENPFDQAMHQHRRISLPERCLLVGGEGRERFVGGSVAPIVSSNQAILGSVLIFQDITARVRAEQEMHLRVERERLLRTLAHRIRRSLDLHEILQTTVDEVRQFLQVERVVIFQFEPDWSGYVIAESLQPGQTPMLNVLLADPCLTVEPCISKYSQSYAQALDDIYAANLESCYVELLERFDVRANLVVSIVVDEHAPWGLLAAQTCSAPRPWREDEVSFLLQLSDQIAVAIHQSRLYQQLQQLNQTLEGQVQERTTQLHTSLQFEALSNRITEKVWQSLDEGQITQTAIQEICEQLDARFCNVSFYSSAELTSPAEAALQTTIVGEYARSAPELETFMLPVSILESVWNQLRQGGVCHFCTAIPQWQTWACVLICPMYEPGDSLLGDLLLLRERDRPFSDAEIQLVRQVTNQCAIAIRQSRFNRAVQSQLAELERLNHLKDDFLSTVSHELRTPMANIRMATQMLEICLSRLGIFDNSSNTIERYFRILKDEGQREINLIDDLLNLSRLEAGVESLNLILVDLQLWVVHIAESFQELAQNRQQDIVLNLPESLPLVRTDLSCLERIVNELLTNALKYTPPEERIEISAQVQADQLYLCITNTGVEIAPEERARIFEKFYRIPNSDRWRHGGTGLGLALARKLARVLNGGLDVTSASDRTTFCLRLPLAAPPLDLLDS